MAEIMKERQQNIQSPAKVVGEICEVCRKPKIIIEENGIESYQECDCAIKKRKEEAISLFENFSKYKGNYKNDTFENFISRSSEEEQLKQKYMLYCKNFEYFKENGVGVLLYGTAGSGKTYLANCIANEISKKGPVLYFQLGDYIKEIKNGWDEKEERILKIIKDVQLVIIDDWGILNEIKDWRYNTIYNLINTLALEKIPLVITTNKDLSELDQDKHQRISDRMNAICNPEMVVFPSRRKGLGMRNFNLVMDKIDKSRGLK